MLREAREESSCSALVYTGDTNVSGQIREHRYSSPNVAHGKEQVLQTATRVCTSF